MEKGIRVYDYASKPINPGFVKPNVKSQKKQVARVGIGKAKQHALWDEETKKGLKTPGPLSYTVNALPT